MKGVMARAGGGAAAPLLLGGTLICVPEELLDHWAEQLQRHATAAAAVPGAAATAGARARAGSARRTHTHTHTLTRCSSHCVAEWFRQCVCMSWCGPC